MLTGDNQAAAKAVADYLGIHEFYSELLPDDKEKIIKQYTDKGKKVMMVGDGINDAPALARATIGMAIGAGTDIAIDSADVVLTNSNLQDILKFVRLAKKTHSKMIQNLWRRLQYSRDPIGCGCSSPYRNPFESSSGRHFNVTKYDHRRDQCDDFKRLSIQAFLFFEKS